MSDNFDLSTEDQQNNLQEFMEVHGPEGFFTIYFRQLLYRFVKQELKTAVDDLDGVGEQLYFSEDGNQLLTEHREELLNQCEVRARELVEELTDHPTLGQAIAEGNIVAIDSHQEELVEAIHRCFENWKAEGIRLLEDIESKNSREENE